MQGQSRAALVRSRPTDNIQRDIRPAKPLLATRRDAAVDLVVGLQVLSEAYLDGFGAVDRAADDRDHRLEAAGDQLPDARRIDELDGLRIRSQDRDVGTRP